METFTVIEYANLGTFALICFILYSDCLEVFNIELSVVSQ